MSSVRTCHNTRNFCKFCNTSIPVPETSGSSVRLPYPYPESTNPTEHNLDKCTPSSAQLSYSSAAQRSAAPCGAVRCCALPCGSVLCRAAPCYAVLSFVHTVPGVVRSTRYQVPVCTCVLVCFAFFIDCPLSVVFTFFFSSQVPPVLPIRTLHRQQATLHSTAQHGAISSAQAALGSIKSLLAPSHGPLLSVPFTFSLHSSLRERVARTASVVKVRVFDDVHRSENDMSYQVRTSQGSRKVSSPT